MNVPSSTTSQEPDVDDYQICWCAYNAIRRQGAVLFWNVFYRGYAISKRHRPIHVDPFRQALSCATKVHQPNTGQCPIYSEAEMKRRNLSTLQRAKIFAAHGGICHLCQCKIDGVREKWEADHIIALELSRDDTDANMAPAHVKCHRTKTDKDVKAIAKAKRIEAKHNGARKPSKFQSRGFGQYQTNVKYIGEM